MKACYFLVSIFLLAAGQASAGPSQWTVEGAPEVRKLRFDGFADKGVAYTFTCAGQTLTATESGVTELMNPQDSRKIGDAPGSSMPAGAAVMTIFTDLTEPAFTAADAIPNAKSGWDLTIRLPLKDPAVRALSKATSMSLMTTGWTGLVQLDAEDHAIISSFMKTCGAAP